MRTRPREKIGRLRLYHQILAVVVFGCPATHVLSAELPECDHGYLECCQDDLTNTLLKNIQIHVSQARDIGDDYGGHADLACFTRNYLYLNIETESEREKRVKILLDLKASSVYSDAVQNAKTEQKANREYYFENILCELHLLGGMSKTRNCGEEERRADANDGLKAVPILQRLVSEQEAARARDKQDAQRALTRLLPAILDQIKVSWDRPSSFVPGSEVKLLILVDRSGRVISVMTERSSGDRVFDNSAELAVKQASPLPFPTEERYHEFIKEFSIGFRPEEPQITTFYLTIRSSPSNARLTVDGTYQGTTPQVVSVEKGNRRIKLTKDGYEDKELSVNVLQDTTRTVRLTKKLLLSAFSGRYFIPFQSFCENCPGSYFLLDISPDNISGQWNLYPGRLTYVLKDTISRESSSCSLMAEKRGSVMGAPSSIRIDFKFSGESVEMTVHESKTKIHRIVGRLQK